MLSGQVDAAMGCRPAEGGFVGKTMDVNVPASGVDVAATIEFGFEAFEPEYAMGDRGFRKPVPRVADRDAGAKGGADGPTLADLREDAVKSEWSPVGVADLADAIAGGGRGKTVVELVGVGSERIRERRSDEPEHLLSGNGCDEQVRGGSGVMAAAGDPPGVEEAHAIAGS